MAFRWWKHDSVSTKKQSKLDPLWKNFLNPRIRWRYSKVHTYVINRQKSYGDWPRRFWHTCTCIMIAHQEVCWKYCSPDLPPLLRKWSNLKFYDQKVCPFADPEGEDRGSGPPPLKNHKNIGFRDPWKITKLPSQRSMLGHHWHASETPFKWRFARWPMMVRS